MYTMTQVCREAEMNCRIYKNYVFDLYGTLVDIHTDEDKPELWHTLCRLLAMRGVFWQAESLRHLYRDKIQELEAKAAAALPEGALAEIEIGEVFRAFFPADQQPDEGELARFAQVFRALSLEKLCLFDGALPLLQRLHAAGKRVYLLSNAQALFTRPELTALGLDNAFDGTLLSSEAGRKKPDPAFFELLLTKYKLDPHETLMIGNDAAADCEGAAKIGIDSRYLETEQSPRRTAPLPPSCRMLRSIKDVF